MANPANVAPSPVNNTRVNSAALLSISSIIVCPGDGDLALYLESLARLQALPSRLLLPSHGPPSTRPAHVLAETVAHRRQREEQLLAALASLVAYRSFTDIPSARVHYLDTVAIQNVIPNFPAIQVPNLLPLVFKSGPNTGLKIPRTVVVEAVHPPETIVGGTLSFFQRHLVPGVVRMEGGYFIGENTCTRIACEGWPAIGLVDTFIPEVDYIRWMIGYDVFDINVPWLSQTNNIMHWSDVADITTEIIRKVDATAPKATAPTPARAPAPGAPPKPGAPLDPTKKPNP